MRGEDRNHIAISEGITIEIKIKIEYVLTNKIKPTLPNNIKITSRASRLNLEKFEPKSA
tara:strand:- start:330 stop:506 length:177 start_codon:yes stop_codon:yes gene_type:complete